MEATDLMVGNWVKVNNQQIKVESIHNDCINYMPDIPYVQEEDYIEICYIEPIPLTDEILKNNGFEYHHKNIASLSYGHPFKLELVNWADENGIGLWMIAGIIRIQYVHELQNALKLAGIEKKIII